MKKLKGILAGLILLILVGVLGYKVYKVTPEELVDKNTIILAVSELSDKKIKEYEEINEEFEEVNEELLKIIGIDREQYRAELKKISKYFKKGYVLIDLQGKFKIVADKGIWYFLANIFNKEELKNAEKELEKYGFKLIKYRGLYVLTNSDDEIVATKDTNKLLLDYVKKNSGRENIVAIDIKPIFKLFSGKDNSIVDLIGIKIDLDKKNIKYDIEVLLTESFAQKFINKEERKVYPEIKDNGKNWLYLSVGDIKGVVKEIMEYYPYQLDESELDLFKGIKEIYLDEDENVAINIVNNDNNETLNKILKEEFGDFVEDNGILYFEETKKNVKFEKKIDSDLFLKGEIVDLDKNINKIELEGKNNIINVYFEMTSENLLKFIDEKYGVGGKK